MTENEFFTVEPSGRRPAIKWRLPAVVVALPTFLGLWYTTCSNVQISGSYEGYLGGSLSDDKTAVTVRLEQVGKEVSGRGATSRILGRQIIKDGVVFVGSVSGTKVNLRGRLDSGGSLILSGNYSSPDAAQTVGTISGSSDLEGQGRKQSCPFLLKRLIH